MSAQRRAPCLAQCSASVKNQVTPQYRGQDRLAALVHSATGAACLVLLHSHASAPSASRSAIRLMRIKRVLARPPIACITHATLVLMTRRHHTPAGLAARPRPCAVATCPMRRQEDLERTGRTARTGCDAATRHVNLDEMQTRRHGDTETTGEADARRADQSGKCCGRSLTGLCLRKVATLLLSVVFVATHTELLE